MMKKKLKKLMNMKKKILINVLNKIIKTSILNILITL